MYYARPGATVSIPAMAMAPFLADPTSKKLFEDEHQRHRRALASASASKEKGSPSLGVVLRKGPAPWPRPRSPPCELDSESYKGFRVRSRDFGVEEQQRYVGQDNGKLVKQLAEIKSKPSVTGKMMAVPPPPPRLKAAPPPPKGEQLLRKKQQWEIQLSNRALVKRITSVRSDPTFDVKKLDGEWRHHQDNVRRLQKVHGWAAPPLLKRRKQNLTLLPQLAHDRGGVGSGKNYSCVSLEHSLSEDEQPKDARLGALLKILEAEACLLEATAEAETLRRRPRLEAALPPNDYGADAFGQDRPTAAAADTGSSSSNFVPFMTEPIPQEGLPRHFSSSRTTFDDAAPALPQALRRFS